jgi:hypothetical protein
MYHKAAFMSQAKDIGCLFSLSNFNVYVYFQILDDNRYLNGERK